MANKVFSLPVVGFSEGLPVDKSDPMTSGYLNNIRAIDILGKRIRIGQRPGLGNWSTTQIGDSEIPVVAMISISTVK